MPACLNEIDPAMTDMAGSRSFRDEDDRAGRSDYSCGTQTFVSTVAVVRSALDDRVVYVFHGSSSGPGGPDWQASAALGADFGWSVSTAGDVDGDGYADLMIGARFHDNGNTDEGAAYLWYGAPWGLGPDGTPANAGWKVESNADLGYTGWSVATAGDVTTATVTAICSSARPVWSTVRPAKGWPTSITERPSGCRILQSGRHSPTTAERRRASRWPRPAISTPTGTAT